MEGYSVHPIKREEAIPWIMKKHYAHRMPITNSVFGLFKEKIIVGVVSYGQATCRMDCELWKPYKLFELNRLVIEDTTKNIGSYFISNTFHVKFPNFTSS